MAVPSDIRDQAYKLFIQEVPDLLHSIESDLLTLRQERNLTKIHNLMRNSHSIKGGAASVGLDEIATLAHRLENIFKALYSESLEISTDLESQLLQVYDCLRLPLMQQVTTGQFDVEQVRSTAEPIFAQVEKALGDI
ncbi:MAG TPA: Hpt domain-containing protein, partial [Allocoleopsis sp.]